MDATNIRTPREIASAFAATIAAAAAHSIPVTDSERDAVTLELMHAMCDQLDACEIELATMREHWVSTAAVPTP